MKHLFTVLGVLFILSTQAQYSANDTNLNIPMFYAAYSFQVPGGDLADRFGTSSTIGGGFRYKTASNWLFDGEFSFIFGGEVKNEDELMSNLRTETGEIIDMSGNFGFVTTYERGYHINFKFGKVIPVLSPNPNSGIVLMGGVGYLQHKIRIQVENNNIPQLDGDYKKGYDRLAGGPSLTEFVGYLYLSDNRLLNFYGGLEFVQGWTKPLRDVNFDTMEPDPIQNRLDLFTGIKLGWIIPIFQRQPEKFYYY
jgi:hypothetical protein